MKSELESALSLARTLPLEEIPRLLGDLEEVRVTALARLAAPAPAQPDELLEVPEAAHRLGVSPAYLYRNHARLPFTRREGRRLLFSSNGLDTYLRGTR